MPINPNGTSWGSEAANCKLQDIRAKVVADFRARDERRGFGPPENGQKTHREVQGDDGSIHLELDPLLACRKASAREVKLVTKSRWAKFNAEPRDEKAYMKERSGTLRDARIRTVTRPESDESKAEVALVAELKRPIPDRPQADVFDDAPVPVDTEGPLVAVRRGSKAGG